MRTRMVSRSVLLVLPLLVAGCATARMQVPEGLAAAPAYEVSGTNPRVWNRPIAFGPWRTAEVKEGLTRGWSVAAFGLGAGAVKRPYELVLTGTDGTHREVACLTRGGEVWRGSLTIDLSGIAGPRLACYIRGTEAGPSSSLVLGQKGREVNGLLRLAGDGERAATYSVASLHLLEGSKLPTSAVAGFAIRRAGRAVAAVETMNRGRVWLTPDLGPETREVLAAAAAALLLFDNEISPRGPDEL